MHRLAAGKANEADRLDTHLCIGKGYVRLAHERRGVGGCCFGNAQSMSVEVNRHLSKALRLSKIVFMVSVWAVRATK